MDSGWAVVIGATVAFIGSIIGSVFGPRWAANQDRQARREEARRDAIRDALLEISTGFNAMRNHRLTGGASPSAFAQTMQGIGRLGLNLQSSEAQIEQIALSNLQIIQRGDEAQMAAALGAWQQIAHRWYRGEIPEGRLPEQAQAELDKTHAEAEALYAQRRAEKSSAFGGQDRSPR